MRKVARFRILAALEERKRKQEQKEKDEDGQGSMRDRWQNFWKY
jgi:hypothetical protein